MSSKKELFAKHREQLLNEARQKKKLAEEQALEKDKTEINVEFSEDIESVSQVEPVDEHKVNDESEVKSAQEIPPTIINKVDIKEEELEFSTSKLTDDAKLMHAFGGVIGLAFAISILSAWRRGEDRDEGDR